MSFLDAHLATKQQEDLNALFKAMKIKAECVSVADGLRTRDFLLKLELGEKVSKIKNISEEIALALKSLTIPTIDLETNLGLVRVSTTINDGPIVVPFKEKIKDLDLSKYEIPLLIGAEMNGRPLAIDLALAPHLLVAGTTGSGKSVLVRSMLETMSNKDPHGSNIVFSLLDPKSTELTKYQDLKNCCAYVDDYEKAAYVLDLTVSLMEKRYKEMGKARVGNFKEFREKINPEPYYVVVIDEFADLVLQDKKEVLKTNLIRLLQKSRAAGIHVIVNTQRPSKEVICGLIKANIPAQIALKCSTNYDSRVIIGEDGAENLVGKGDLLLKMDGKLTRAQATFV